MKCPYCNNKKVDGAKCGKCKAAVPVRQEPVAENNQSAQSEKTIFGKKK